MDSELEPVHVPGPDVPGPPAELRARWLLPAILAVLIGANIAISILDGSSVYVAVGAVAVMLLLARLAGHTRHSLGLIVTKRSAIWAGVIGVVVWAGLLGGGWLAMRFGFAGELTKDPRSSGLDAASLLFSLVVVIPVGTVMLEEVGFRSVLMGELHRVFDHVGVKKPVLFAGICVSILFGLWHIGPAIVQATATGMYGLQEVGLVAGTVAFTAVSGFLFAWLRHHTRSVLTPAVLHGAVNAAGLVVVWLLARGIG